MTGTYQADVWWEQQDKVCWGAVRVDSSDAVPERVIPAHLGRPRAHRTDGAAHVVRVELRLPPHIANLLFLRAEQTGRTVSRVGGDALWRALSAEVGEM
jgi:hypothetical protein